MAVEPKLKATAKRTPVDPLTKHVLVLLPGIMSTASKGLSVQEKVRLAYEAAAELESIERDLKTAWSGDECTDWAVRFWCKYEGIK